MSGTPEWIKTLRGIQKNLGPAPKLLALMHQARGGGPLDLILAGVGAAQAVVDHFYPYEDLEQLVVGVHGLQWGFRFPLLDVMRARAFSAAPCQVVSVDRDNRKFFMYQSPDDPMDAFGFYIASEGAIPVVYHRTRSLSAYFQKLLGAAFEGESACLSADRGKDDVLTVTRLDPPGAYVSVSRPPEYYIERLRRYGDGPRTIIIRGGSGYGKSVLAQHIAQGLRPGGSVLKVSSESLHRMSINAVHTAAAAFKPSVLLLDDVDLDTQHQTERYLDLFERLRFEGTLTIGTHMVSPKDQAKPREPGCYHYDGGRPGRIDEIFNIDPYTPEDRAAILDHYAGLRGFNGFREHPDVFARLVNACEGLSGAYLSSLVEKIDVHGIENWHEELINIQLQAPAVSSGEGTKAESSTATKVLSQEPIPKRAFLAPEVLAEGITLSADD